MRKNNSRDKQLDFNFDEPAPISVKQMEDMKKQKTGFMSEIEDADSYHWGRNNTTRRGNMLTADEVMAHSYSAKAHAAQKAQAEPAQQSVVADTDKQGSSGMSFAARMVMQRVKEVENRTQAEEDVAIETKSVKPEVIEMKPSVASEPEKKPAEPILDLSDFEAKVEFEPENEQKVEAEQDDEYDIKKTRKSIVDAFELDSNFIDVGDDSADSADAADLAGTVMFAPPAPTDRVNADGATRVIDIDDEFDFTLSNDGDGKGEVETIDDYTSVDDAEAVVSDFMHRRRSLRLRSTASAIISALLVIMTFVSGVIPFELTAFFITYGVLLGIGILFNLGIFTSVASLFKGKCDTDFAPMFALSAAFVQNLVVGLCGATDGMGAVSMCGAVAMLSVTFNCIGKLYMVRRILINLENVANDEDKTAVTLIDVPVSSSIANPSKVGETLIAGRRKAIDLQGFVGYSLSADIYEGQSFRLIIISLAAALVAAVVSLFTDGGAVGACNAVALAAAVSAPFSALSVVGRRLFKIAKRLRNEGAMLSGFKAADDIAEANAVVIGADELYSDDCVSLYNFKTFNDFPIDTAIIMSAALTKSGNSPLSDMFNQIVATNSGKLPLVDSVIYEGKMGLTGWVDNRKTLIGNRMILESHNIPVPPISVDKKIINSGKFPVYLAIDDKIAAMFIVGYSHKKSLVHRIRRLINTGVTLIVDTSDPNISEQLVADTYGIPEDAILVLPANASRIYREHTAPAETEQARLSSSTPEGFVDGYVAAYKLRHSSMLITVLTLIMVSLGLCAVVFSNVLGIGDFVNSLSITALHTINYLLVAAVNFFNRH